MSMSKDHASSTPKKHLHDGGHIEAVEITRSLTRAHPEHRERAPHELQFAGRPISRASKAERVRLVFVDPGHEPPPPEFHAREKRIDLFYSREKYHSLRNWLNGRTTRLCYFWSSSDGRSRQAWLVGSPA
jgi:hypothetical protein